MEIVAVVFGLLNVYLLTKQNIWAWPCGLVMVTLYAFIFFDAKLYSDFILHLVYIILNVYGWFYWLRGGSREDNLPVTIMNTRQRVSWLISMFIGFLLWGFFMSTTTDADYPYPDAFTTVLSLVAQYLLARKKLENWILWITVDLVAINLYLLKSLYFTSGLYFCFLILCLYGIRSWKKSMAEIPGTETK
ncbi:MAG: nicotinamide riboside transporter PnuC [Saprospiraceae bacterium]|nr:nicotinamide riboside transporter PnuC [Saprospiraceae bacterium]